MAIAVLLTVLAPVLGYVSIRNAAYESTGFRSDFGGVLPPPSPQVGLREVMKDARVPRRPVLPEVAIVVRAGAVSAPLAFEPFFIAARVADTQGRYGQATRLMEEARRRRPNYTPIRVSLLGYYGVADAYQQAIDEASIAMRVNTRTIDYILPAFARLVAEDERARRAIGRALARGPAWDTRFYDVAARSGMRPDDAFALIDDTRRAGGNGDRAAQDKFLIEILVKANRFADARAYWQRTTGRGVDPGALVIDGRFDRNAAPPFGWALQASPEGVAERARAGGSEPAHLGVSYFGNARATFAEQLLVLQPGAYRLQVRARAEGAAEGAALVWYLRCGTGDAVLLSMPLAQAEQPRPQTADFTVPSGCTAQRLQLSGQPSDLPRTITAQIYEVAISRRGGAPR